MIWGTILAKFIHLLPMKKQNANGYSLMIASWVFWLSLKLSPWIKYIAADDVAATWKKIFDTQERSGKPIMLIGNHVSFIDTPMVSGFLPMRASFRMKTLMKE